MKFKMLNKSNKMKFKGLKKLKIKKLNKLKNKQI